MDEKLKNNSMEDIDTLVDSLQFTKKYITKKFELWEIIEIIKKISTIDIKDIKEWKEHSVTNIPMSDEDKFVVAFIDKYCDDIDTILRSNY